MAGFEARFPPLRTAGDFQKGVDLPPLRLTVKCPLVSAVAELGS